MLKDRQEGLVNLHACALALTAAAVFAAWTIFVQAIGLIKFAENARPGLYFIGVLGASAWVFQSLQGARTRLGNLNWLEAAHLGRQQITRVIVVLFTLAFVTKDVGVSRAFLMGYIAIMAGIYWVANVYYPRLIVRLFFHHTAMRTVLISASDEVADVSNWMKSRQHFGLQVIGWIAVDKPEGESQIPCLGSLRDLRRVLLEHDVGQVVISQWRFRPDEAREIAACAEELGCRVRFFSNVQHYFRDQHVTVEHEGEYTFVTFTAEPLDNPLNRMLKRALDIAIALPVVLFVLPPLTLAVWAMQRVQSPGPIFHKQHRSGWNRRKFLIYKFRTMHAHGEAGSLTKQAQRNDSRIFPFGRFLRRTSLDEIPQFLNVLQGEMSVSGPRPHLLEHDEQFARVVNSYYTRHFVKPGITGLAQSKGYRGEISEPALLHRRLGYDMLYIKRWTIFLDLQILMDTVRQVFFPPRSAY